MAQGFLKYGDKDAYAVYGAYTALVYMTPYFGGMLADRLLGARRAIIIGGVLMAFGQLLLTVKSQWAFFAGLGLLICGNGFFKPNISAIVGSLYPRNVAKRDAGFTMFYMGINLGAAMSPLICAYVADIYGWPWGFGLATIGMLIGVAIFVAPTRVTQALVLLGALGATASLLFLHPDNPFSLIVNVFVACSLLAAAVTACTALGRGGIPAAAGAPPDRERLRKPAVGPISAEWAVYLGTALAIIASLLLVSGFAPFTAKQRPVSLLADSVVRQMEQSASPLVQAAAVVAREISRPAGLVLMVCVLLAFGYLTVETFRLPKVPRHRMYVVLILIFFSMVFWAFYEQAGSSLNNFADRNVNRVFGARPVVKEEVGTTIRLQPTQEQLGYHDGDRVFTINVLNKLREQHKEDPGFKIDWKVTEDDVGMGVAKRVQEIPAPTFQSVNAIYILVFGLLFTALWTALADWGLEPSTPLKFSMGLLQLGLGFAAFWYGAQSADAHGMVWLGWLLLGYLLHTTGELCLSPVGLAMITRLSPRHLVSTLMGTWFLGLAVSELAAGIIAQFTGVTKGEGSVVPVPEKTVHVYGNVYGKLAIAACVCSLVCFALSPLLTRWMHVESEDDEEQP